MPALSHPDEDFINKSLLASLDAQADAEPGDDCAADNNTQDNDHDLTNDNNYYDQSKFGAHKQSFRASFTSFPNTTRTRQQPFYPDSFLTSPVQSQIQSYDSRQLYDFPYPAKSHNPYPQQQQYNNPVQLSSQTPYGPHVAAIANPATNPPPPPPAPATNVSLAMQNAPNGEEISTIFVVGFPEDMQEREFQNMFTFSAGFEAATLKIPNKEYTAYGSLVGGPPGTTMPNGIGMRGGAFQYAGPNDPYNLVTVNQGGVVVDGGRDGTMASWPAPTSADDLSNGHYLGTGPGGAAGLGLGSMAAGINLPPRKQIIGFAKFRSREEALAARDILQGRRVDIEKGAVLKAEMAKKNLHTKRGVGPVPGAGVGLGGLQQQASSQQQHMNGLSVTGMDAFNTDPTGFATATSSNRDSMPALARLGWRDSLQGSQGQDASNPAANTLQTNGALVNGREDEDRKRDSLLSMGLGGLSLSNATTSSAANTTGQRGPRERAEEDEREQWRRKEKEKEMNLMRLRANNAAAFDAFHGVPANMNGVSAAGAPGMSRQSSTASGSSGSIVGGGAGGSNGLWTAAPTASTVPTESVAASSPMLGDAEAQQRDGEDVNQQKENEDEVVGRVPWDRYSNNVNSYAAVARPVGAGGGSYSGNGVQHHATESERSTSPTPSTHAPGAFGYQGGGDGGQQQYQSPPQYQPQYMHLHEQQQQAAHQQHLYEQQQQQQQHLYQNMYHHHSQQQQHPFRSSQSESSETGSVVGAESSPSTSNNPNVNPIGYVGARLGYATGFGSVVSVSSSSSNARDPVSVMAGASTSLSKTQISGFSFGSMSTGRVGGGEVYASQNNPNVAPGAGMIRSLSSVNGNGSAVSPPAGTATVAASSSSNVVDGAGPTPVNTNGVIGGPAMSSAGSSSGGSISGSGGNTSPQLPSPASVAGSGGSAAGSGVFAAGLASASGSVSGGSAGSIASSSGATSAGGGVNGTGGMGVRGTVDQNPPINTLYVGNLPTSPLPLGYSSDYLEETLRTLFSACPGFRKLCFRQKANGPMCFIEFIDVQQATDALKALSGNTLNGTVKNGIRLSYSKNPLGVRTPTSAGGNSSGHTLQQQQQLMQTLNNHSHHPQYQQHQMGPPPSSATSSGSNDAFQARLAEEFGGGHIQQQQHRLPTTILRRDSTLSPTTMSSMAQAQGQAHSYMSSSGSSNGSGNGNGNGNGGSVNGNSFFSSPPPRFYTTSPPGLGFGTSSTPLTSASGAFIPRSAANGGPGAGMGMFSSAVSGFGGYGGGGGAGGASQTTFSPFGMSFSAHHENVFVPQQVPHLPQLSIPGDQHQHQQPQSLADD